MLNVSFGRITVFTIFHPINCEPQINQQALTGVRRGSLNYSEKASDNDTPDDRCYFRAPPRVGQVTRYWTSI